MRFLWILLMVCGGTAFGRLEKYSQFVAADPPGQGVPAHGVRVTYLGTNGYLFESGTTAIVVDPYFTRVSLISYALNLPVRSNEQAVNQWTNRLPHRIDAILATHAHIDHLLDVPAVAARTGAHVYAPQTAINLVRAADKGSLPNSQLTVIRPGMNFRTAGARVTVLPAHHDRIAGQVPMAGEARPGVTPRRVYDWRCGEAVAYLIELSGKRIYIDSGGLPGAPPPPVAGGVDLAIAGMALADSRRRLPELLHSLKPRIFLPSHQDNFFRPLDRGFAFNIMTDQRFVKDQWDLTAPGGRFILLDYFQPWTLR